MFRHMRTRSELARSCALLAAALALLALCSAEGSGVTGANFLTLGCGARVEAMGGAGTASASGIDATYWNAASLGRSAGGNVSFSHAAWFADIDYEYVGVQSSKRACRSPSSSILHTDGMQDVRGHVRTVLQN
jgi:hypothetical protein